MDEDHESTSRDDSQTSLIPTIRAEETRLQDMLAKAKSQAAASIDQAKREAAELVRDTREALPKWIAVERDEQLERIRAVAEQRGKAGEERTESLQKAAARNMTAAVDCILASVWGMPE